MTNNAESCSKPGILKRSSSSKKPQKKKNRVQFNENLNVSFEADYVILVRDDEYIDENFIACDCGNQFCYMDGVGGGGYYMEGDEDGELEHCVDFNDENSNFDLNSSFDPLTLSPPDEYKDGCTCHIVPPINFKVNMSTMTTADGEENSHQIYDCDNKSVACNFECNSDIPTDKISDKVHKDFSYTNSAAKNERSLNDLKNEPIKVDGKSNTGDTEEKNGNSDKDKKLPITGTDLENSISSSEFLDCPSGTEYYVKIGKSMIIPSNLKPNSAVRQLFPDNKIVPPPPGTDDGGKCEGKYLVTEESLRAFNEVNRRSFLFSPLDRGKEIYPYINKEIGDPTNSDDEEMLQNDLIKKTIERSTLRRSFMKNPKGDRRKRKSDISLEERIRRLTMVDDEPDIQLQSKPVVAINEEYYATNFDDHPAPKNVADNEEPKSKFPDNEETTKSLDIKKFTDSFTQKPDGPGANTTEQHYPYYQPVYNKGALPVAYDGGPVNTPSPVPNAKFLNPASEGKNPFLSSLAPLTACVSRHRNSKDKSKIPPAPPPRDRNSIISTASIDENFNKNPAPVGVEKSSCNHHQQILAPKPDVVAGTPTDGSHSQDKLAMFLQRDANRIERLKKQFSSTTRATTTTDNDDDDEHDDYGFNKRSSSSKHRICLSNEILEQMQEHLQHSLPSSSSVKIANHTSWPPLPRGSTGTNNKTSPVYQNENNAQSPAVSITANSRLITENNSTTSNVRRPFCISACSVTGLPLSAYKINSQPLPPQYNIRKVGPNNFSIPVAPFKGNPQTFAVPYPCGPVNLHFGFKYARVDTSSFPINPQQQQQLVVSRAMQTASSVRFQQTNRFQNVTVLPTAPTPCIVTPDPLFKTVHMVHSHQPSSTFGLLTCSPTRIIKSSSSQNQFQERGIPEGASSTASFSVDSGNNSSSQHSTAATVLLPTASSVKSDEKSIP